LGRATGLQRMYSDRNFPRISYEAIGVSDMRLLDES